MQLHLLDLYAQLVARAKLLLEMQAASQAAEPASGHDSNAVTKYVCFLHAVRGQHDSTLLLH